MALSFADIHSQIIDTAGLLASGGCGGRRPPRIVLLLLLFASEAGKKQQQKDHASEGFALQTSHLTMDDGR